MCWIILCSNHITAISGHTELVKGRDWGLAKWVLNHISPGRHMGMETWGSHRHPDTHFSDTHCLKYHTTFSPWQCTEIAIQTKANQDNCSKGPASLFPQFYRVTADNCCLLAFIAIAALSLAVRDCVHHTMVYMWQIRSIKCVWAAALRRNWANHYLHPLRGLLRTYSKTEPQCPP